MTTDPILFRTDPVDADPPPPPPHRGRLLIAVIGSAVLVGGLIVVLTLLPGWLTTPEGGPRVATPATAASGDARRIQATLYYLSADGTKLSGTSRSVAFGDTPSAQALRIVEAQIAAPPDGLASAIPPGTIVQAVFVTADNEAYVDLGGTIVTGHAGGSLDEALTVYAIVNAITINLLDITAVQILIDGKEVDSLVGHIDLRAPLAMALDWVEKEP
jgi:hypothetical protein